MSLKLLKYFCSPKVMVTGFDLFACFLFLVREYSSPGLGFWTFPSTSSECSGCKFIASHKDCKEVTFQSLVATCVIVLIPKPKAYD